MDLGTLLLDLALLGLVAYVIVRPLMNRTRPDKIQAEPAAGLLAEHERLLSALGELELDQATGKIDAEDGARQRAQLVAQGASVLRQLDEVTARPASRRKPQAPRSTDDEIEAAINQVRRSRRSQPAAATAPRPSNGQVCPSCGQAAHPGDRFCAGCGAELGAACRRCGSSLGERDLFCANCGARVAEPQIHAAQPEPQR